MFTVTKPLIHDFVNVQSLIPDLSIFFLYILIPDFSQLHDPCFFTTQNPLITDHDTLTRHPQPPPI